MKYKYNVEQHEIYSDYIEVEADSPQEALAKVEAELVAHPLEFRKNTFEDTETTIKLKEIDGMPYNPPKDWSVKYD